MASHALQRERRISLHAAGCDSMLIVIHSTSTARAPNALWGRILILISARAVIATAALKSYMNYRGIMLWNCARSKGVAAPSYVARGGAMHRMGAARVRVHVFLIDLSPLYLGFS